MLRSHHPIMNYTVGWHKLDSLVFFNNGISAANVFWLVRQKLSELGAEGNTHSNYFSSGES